MYNVYNNCGKSSRFLVLILDGSFKVPFNKTGLDHRSVQQHPRYSSTPRYNGNHIPRTYRTMYDKTYGAGASGKSAWGVSRSVSVCESNSARSKLAAKEVSVLF